MSRVAIGTPRWPKARFLLFGNQKNIWVGNLNVAHRSISIRLSIFTNSFLFTKVAVVPPPPPPLPPLPPLLLAFDLLNAKATLSSTRLRPSCPDLCRSPQTWAASNLSWASSSSSSRRKTRRTILLHPQFQHEEDQRLRQQQRTRTPPPIRAPAPVRSTKRCELDESTGF